MAEPLQDRPLPRSPSQKAQRARGRFRPAAVGELTAEMLKLMRENAGVGLAAPQVGRNIRVYS